MDIGSISRAAYVPLPVFQDMAVVLAARPSMAQMSASTAADVSARADGVKSVTASITGDGTVDMYL